MNFRTTVDIPRDLPKIGHSDRILLMGSCFAEHIGRFLMDSKFNCDVNPFGILYNPASILVALRQIMDGKRYTDEDLFFYQERYCSYMHHGSFAAGSPDEALEAINDRIEQAHRSLPQITHLLLTFGTSWVYSTKESGCIVSNCHKVPSGQFQRTRLTVEDVVAGYDDLIRDLLAMNPDCKVILAVSPIRHMKDGMHGNQMSKAVLLLAVDVLQEHFPENVFYFPSYEIVLDELRDYRFYADDMVHPSSLAIEYIWERFSSGFFSDETQGIMKECERIRKDLLHKPFHRDSNVYKVFLDQIVLKIDRLSEKYPTLDVEKEKEQCRILLNQ